MAAVCNSWTGRKWAKTEQAMNSDVHATDLVWWIDWTETEEQRYSLGLISMTFKYKFKFRLVDWFEVKLSPKCIFCECMQVKPLCKSIIMTKEALLRLTVFSSQTHFKWECMGYFYNGIKIAIFKTLRRLDTTWNFACSITRVSTNRSTEPLKLYPDVSIPEYIWAAMTTARGRSCC